MPRSWYNRCVRFAESLFNPWVREEWANAARAIDGNIGFSQGVVTHVLRSIDSYV